MCSEWSVAQVLSHLGSGAEIFYAVVTETPVDNQEVWARWNAKHAADMAASFVPADEKLVAWFEALSPDELTTRQIKLPFLPAPISAGDCCRVPPLRGRAAQLGRVRLLRSSRRASRPMRPRCCSAGCR